MSENTSPEALFEITREFNAPRDLVFKAWTNADALAKWWGPKGSKTTVAKFDLRPGGVFHYSLEMGNTSMWGKFVYREITPPERLVYVSSFSDENEAIADAPFPGLTGKWPLEILNIVTFTEAGGKTTVALSGGPINATAEQIETYKAMNASMQQGFGGTLDQLDEYLASL